MLHRSRARPHIHSGPTWARGLPPGFVEGVGVFLHTPGRGRGVPVLVDALTLRDVHLRIRNEIDPLLRVGGHATVELVHESGVDVRLAARLVQLREHRIARSLTLSFLDPAGASDLLDPRLARLFDKRGSFRVAPEPHEPVEVTVMATGADRDAIEAASVLDVSTGGLGIVVSRPFERIAAATTRIRCLLRLPGGGTAHAVDAEIRHRSLYGDGFIRYGLCLDLASGASDRRVYDELLAYVLARLAAV